MTLAVILAVSALFSYHYFSHNLREQVDRQVREIARTLDQNRADIIQGDSTELNCSGLQLLTHSNNWGAFVVLRDASLQVVCTSDNLLERELPFGPVARQQGVASRLLRQALAVMSKRSARRVFLEVACANLLSVWRSS